MQAVDMSNAMNVCELVGVPKSIKSFNKFHPVGHGTFFTGVLHLGGNASTRRFTWVYDCGSKKRNDLIKMIDGDGLIDLPMSKIDMLCLSHFDDDHINGVDCLIRKFGVKALVLPYLPFNQRLQIAFEKKSIDVLMFALDPVGYLQINGLLDKVDKIFLIQSSDTPASNTATIVNRPVDSVRDEEYDIFPKGAQPDTANYPDLIAGGDSISSEKQREISGGGVKNLLSEWEFVFFNLPLKLKSLTPDVSLSDVHVAVRKILNSNKKDSNKIKNLQQCYIEYFGYSGKKRNDISLCVLFRSLNSSGLCYSMNKIPVSRQVDSRQSICCAKGNGFGMLLTGDITINESTLSLMQAHFGAARWNDIYVMQIPHHGSINSWQAGNHNILQHTYSILCIPDVNKRNRHPNDNVLKDLEGTKLLQADYSNSVIYIIFDCPALVVFNESSLIDGQAQPVKNLIADSSI